ncbi:MAG: Panacea domain-containing protein, partial [Muribaculum sp.]|nr:Panacea domain-containing protein [Muribaculum sp.]
ELDEANLFQVYNEYRTRHAIPFPDQIIGLREHYRLSAAKMSQILGFGINQYRMYEDGEVPSLSNARTLLAAGEKALFKSFVEAAKSDMSDSEFVRVMKKVEETDGDYKMDASPTVFTGYRTVSAEKISAAIKRLVAEMGPIFVTKMNKLLFYADFLHYKQHGYGITGLTYRAMQYGPVPEGWGRIYSSLPGIVMEEFVYPSGQSGIQLKSDSPSDMSVLSESERETLSLVCELFKDMSAGDISNVSHKEKAWSDNISTKSEISYQEAFALNY